MSALEAKYEVLIESLVPLAALSDASRAQVLGQAEVLRYRRGDILFREGDQDPYTLYLLEGRLELLAAGQTVQRLAGGSPAAAHALAQLQPRKMSARAETDVAVLRVSRELLERLLMSDGGGQHGAMQVNEFDADVTDDGDWMTRMLQSKLFSLLPAANIHRIFSLLETIDVRAGDTVVKQGEPGDYYFIIAQGRGEVLRSSGPNAPGYRLAMIGPGDSFGEEALVAGSNRNASVRMLSDGQLVRLPKEAFLELIQKPLLSAVTYPEGQQIVATRGAQWLDVRFPEEHSQNGLEGSINHPLNTLRMHSGRLDQGTTYLVYCDTGGRSAVAAFLLAERGFDVHFLEGGLMRYDLMRAPSLDLTLHDDDALEPVPAPVAPVPTSHMTDHERHTEAAMQAASLVRVDPSAMPKIDPKAPKPQRPDPTVAAKTRTELEARLRAAAEKARRDAEQEATRKIEAERQRIAAELERQRVEVERRAAEKLRAEKRRIQVAAEAARRELAEAQRLKAEIERARGDAQAAAVAAAQQEAAEARRLKEELERARAEAEAIAARQLSRDKAEAERLQAEVLRARADADA
ncbi:MAG: cyclic nucleotide-binding domain-containing protein, partial [Gammaproteobacteria bacterium]|nr:cyclic nucleotide-binding domain-containing protein [Gammaproteobacteria bacterium]